MASVKVAVRVRPLNQRELDMESKFIIQMENKKTSITNIRIPESAVGDFCRDRVKDFTFDHSYWSVSKKSPLYASQDEVFKDLGLGVVTAAYEGYNACVFAYGQTGSGKTYTMMGNPGDVGLIPKICEELFTRMTDQDMTYRTEVSYLEIYNEKVRDLLKGDHHKVQHSLRVREHPKDGPYVQDLSKHLVMNFSDILELMVKGNENRTTASTLMNDVSSRSHAIFTVVFTQAKFSKECPLETESKIRLVDLAGSERADSSGATGQRLKEGGSINKSLVTLGNVISALADLSEKGNIRKTVFIPYRDSVLTWLLKDSLGGNAKTMMIATISPADCNYGETMSTLRYANRAKNIINKPRVNEDPNVKLIRELRQEIARLRDLLGGNIDKTSTPMVQERLTENEARIKVLTEEWAGKWMETTKILEEETTLALRKEGHGVVLDSDLPHLIGIDDDILSTGIMLYHLNEGNTTIGMETEKYKPDIVLQGIDLLPLHCTIDHNEGIVTLQPAEGAHCSVNGFAVTESLPLTQGAVILLGKTTMFRFNHPGQVAQLKKEFKGSNLNLSRVSLLSQSMTDLCRSTENLTMNNTGYELEKRHQEQLKTLNNKRQEIEEMEAKFKHSELSRLEEQQEHEEELQTKRTQLDQLRGEAESMKEQAQKAKKRADREAAKYKRRSMDVERQLHDFMEQQMSGDGAANNSAAIASDKERILKELEKEIERKKENLEQERELELRLLQAERDQLNSIKQDYKSFAKFTSEMEDSTRERLQSENERLVSAQKTLSERERLMFDQYKLEEKQILDDQKKSLKLVDDDKWILEADKIYVRELEANLQQMADEARTDVEKEELEREKEALEEEKSKISGKEQALDQRRRNIEQDMAKRLQELQVKRNHQVESLNVSRSLARSLEENWRQLVSGEIQNKDRTIEEVEMRIQDCEEELEGLEDRHASTAAQVHSRSVSQATASVTNQGDGPVEGSIHESHPPEAARTQLKSSGQTKARDIVSCETASLAENNESNGINKKEVRFVESRSVATAAMVEGNGNSLTKAQYNSLVEGERKNLLTKMQELSNLEEQLRSNENVLDDKCRQFEEQRQQELINIEKKRYNLQELEDQERINSLVEQEVQRRILEERLDRERLWITKREQEREERDGEMSRIRKSHQRELNRLKEKYEGTLLCDNLPTRANPYAAFTSGDASHGVCLTSSKRSKMERAASIASIHSTISSMSPITGNPFSVMVPTFLHRGSGLDVYYEYEVKLSVLEDKWSVFRRYRRFRELHLELKLSYPEVAGLVFPPKKFFGSRSEKTVAERRLQLESYLQHVLEVLWRKPESSLHPSKVIHYSKKVLCDFNAFFKKGVFETGKYSTG